jgi:hypothetical protein
MGGAMSDSAEPKKPAARPFPWLIVGGCVVFGMFACCCVGGVGTWYTVEQVRVPAERRAKNSDNMRNIGLALFAYEKNNHKEFPPAAIKDKKTGKQLLSWRVLLLPYLEEGNLFTTIKLDEPWDSEHNRKFWDRMPKTYQLPGKPNDGKTYYRAFHGEESFFHNKDFPTRVAAVTDGLSNTIVLADAATPVNWMQPDEIPFRMNQPDLMKHIGDHWGNDSFCALFGDGTIHYLKRSMPPATLEALVTRNGGEAVDFSPWEAR